MVVFQFANTPCCGSGLQGFYAFYASEASVNNVERQRCRSVRWPLGQNNQRLRVVVCLAEHLPCNIRCVRPHSNNTSKQHDIRTSPEDQWKHWLYAVILTLSFHDFGFYWFRVLGFRVSGFRVYRVCYFGKYINNLNPAKGFEHVKGYAGLAADKLRGCSDVM